MKFFSIILSFCVLLLTAAPSLSVAFNSMQNENCKMYCCKTAVGRQAAPVSQQNKNCNIGICNPFMHCCNCVALITQPQWLSAPSEYSNQNSTSIKEKSGVGFLCDPWNPPKIV